MADQIFADGPIDAPAVYEVPGSSEIIPIAVQAVLDGSGASGDFVPTLIFRSQAGHVIARVPTETTVAAGESAEVSWFPGVKRSPSSTPAATGLPAAYAATDPFSITAGGVVFPSYTFFQTNAPALFSHPGAHPTWIQIAGPGVYTTLTVINLVTSPTSLTGVLTVNTALLDSFGNPTFPIWNQPVSIRDATVGDPKEVSNAQGFSIDHTSTNHFSPYHAIVDAFSAVALNVSSIQTYIRQDSPTPLS